MRFLVLAVLVALVLTASSQARPDPIREYGARPGLVKPNPIREYRVAAAPTYLDRHK